VARLVTHGVSSRRKERGGGMASMHDDDARGDSLGGLSMKELVFQLLVQTAGDDGRFP